MIQYNRSVQLGDDSAYPVSVTTNSRKWNYIRQPSDSLATPWKFFFFVFLNVFISTIFHELLRVNQDASAPRSFLLQQPQAFCMQIIPKTQDAGERSEEVPSNVWLAWSTFVRQVPVVKAVLLTPGHGEWALATLWIDTVLLYLIMSDYPGEATGLAGPAGSSWLSLSNLFFFRFLL